MEPEAGAAEPPDALAQAPVEEHGDGSSNDDSEGGDAARPGASVFKAR